MRISLWKRKAMAYARFMAPLDVSLHVAAAAGFVRMGDWAQALETIQGLPSPEQISTDVLRLKIPVLNGLHKWHAMESVARNLATIEPREYIWFAAWACAKRFGGNPETADKLVQWSFSGVPANAKVIYALAAYACVLGDTVTARLYLTRAVQLQPSLGIVAFEDPELRSIWKS